MAERSDVEIVAARDNPEYIELQEEFFGYSSLDCQPDTNITSGCISEEDSETEQESQSAAVTSFDFQAAIHEVGTTDHDDETSLIPNRDTEILVVQTQVNNGCGCPKDCYKQFTVDEVYSARLEMVELDKEQRDMLLLGKLMVFGRTGGSVSHARKVIIDKRQRITYEYSYDHRIVCRSVFCFIHAISEKVLKNLQTHLKENGPVPRVHGNKACLPHNTFSFETVEFIASFISNYAELYGLPQPAAGRGRAETPPIYLPARDGYNLVHKKYVEACASRSIRAAKYHAFVGIWHKILPHIKFMSPRTDVCHYCESYRVAIKEAILETDKIRLAERFKDHVTSAQKEREFYLTCIERSKKPDVSTGFSHYTFDFAQELQVPYHARQVGPLYFKVPLKVQLFGICDGSTNTQVNYMYDESQTIGINGTHSHGPNSVVSMLHHFLSSHSCDGKELHFHADNCVGQNKNRTVIGYLAWRIICGLNPAITLSFMQVGHRRCYVDGNFGLIKKFYRSSDIDTVQQLEAMVNNSSKNNIAQMYNWEWREWDTTLDEFFKPIKGITKYQHFLFRCTKIGKVSVKVACDSEPEEVSILKKGITVERVKEAEIPSVIGPGGMTRERKKYLYDKVREHVWPQFWDITCPLPF